MSFNVATLSFNVTTLLFNVGTLLFGVSIMSQPCYDVVTLHVVAEF